MQEKLIKILEELNYPVFLQGSLNADEIYPETFITFWNNSSDDGSHYDNKPSYYIWNFDVNVYSINPNVTNTLLLEIKLKLIENGFIVGGNGRNIMSDEATHTGRTINVQIIDIRKEE